MELEFCVSSDNKQLQHAVELIECPSCGHIQKIVTPTYNEQLDKLYEDYDAYQLNNGKEEKNFASSIPFSRCEQILINCDSIIPQGGKYLDIGTGSGVMLNAIVNRISTSKSSNKLQLNVQDISSHHKKRICEQYEVRNFYAGSIDKIDSQFNFITLIHVLEHVLTPHSFLQQLSKLLTPCGVAIIQVPDIETNYWDMAIFDHVSHFSSKTLVYLLTQHFPFVYLADVQIGKEITAIVSHTPQELTGFDKVLRENASNKKTFQYMQESLNILRNIDESVNVLGTGPSASFAGNILGKRLTNWLDEDINKRTKQLHNRLIQHIDEANRALPLFLPYPQKQVNLIKKRLKQFKFVN